MAQDAIINRWNINGDVYDIQDVGRGRPLGVATLDENGRVPYTQLPESAIEFKGYWDASTNTPHLADGTGTKGDLYYVDVAGTQDLGSGSQVFEVGDRVLYDGSVWMNMKSGGTNIEVYPTMSDLEQDLPNLEDGTIVATEEGDAFTTVDTVQSGVFNPVTSNAVAQELEWVNIDNSVTVGVSSSLGNHTISRKHFWLSGNFLKTDINVVFSYSGTGGTNPIKLSLTSALFTTDEFLSKAYSSSFYGTLVFTVGFNVYANETNIITVRPNGNFSSGTDVNIELLIPITRT